MKHDEVQQRLERLGVQSLSDAELVWLLAGAQVAPSLRALAAEAPENLTLLYGISRRGAGRLSAAFELGRRARCAGERRPRLQTAHEVYAHVGGQLSTLRREEFHLLCFNARQRLVRHVRVAEGAVDACPVDPREVFGPAVAVRASSIVLVHNHPAGDPEPSVFDVALTRRLVEAGQVLSIRVVDHLVIGAEGYVSFAERGLLGVAAASRPSVQVS